MVLGRTFSRQTCTLQKTVYVLILYNPRDHLSQIQQILCWELVSKRGAAWTLHYVKSAYGVTDTPDQVCYLQLSTLPRTIIEPPLIGSRVDFSAKAVAERFILRRYPQYFPFPLYLPFVTQFNAQVLDPRRNGLPGFQPYFLLVCPCKAHSSQLPAIVTNGNSTGLIHRETSTSPSGF